jgi:hypothetical protein
MLQIPYGRRKSGSWTPNSIIGCKLWLKADTGITKDGSDYVSQWDDQSGNGNNVIQGNTGYQPKYYANSLNGYPVIRFNAVNDLLYKSSFDISSTNNITIIFVAKQYSYTGEYNFISFGYAAPYTDLFLGIMSYNIGGLPFVAYMGTVAGTNPRSTPRDTRIISTYSYVSCTFNTSLSTKEAVLYINGTTQDTYAQNDNIPTGNFATKELRIGTRSTGSQAMNGDIAEIIIYDSALGTTDRQTVENYLKTKYGL